MLLVWQVSIIDRRTPPLLDAAAARSAQKYSGLLESVDNNNNASKVGYSDKKALRSSSPKNAEEPLEIQVNEFTNITNHGDLEKVENAGLVSVRVSQPGDLSNSTIYKCGYNFAQIFAHVYPEIKDQILNATHLKTREMAQLATKNDVLILGGGGDCGFKKGSITGDWLEDNFKGTIFIINGENHVARDKWSNLEDISTIPKNQYHLGTVADGCQSRRLHFIAQEFLRLRHLWDFFPARRE